MKHSYIWIGNKIRNSPEPIRGLHIHWQDDHKCAGGCGYNVCSRTGPCAPAHPYVPRCTSCWGFADAHATGCALNPQAPAPEPQPDVLPEGWVRLDSESQHWFMHSSGASVWRVFEDIHPEMHSWGWAWSDTNQGSCYRVDCKPTRELAMAAALASVQSAEPKLREGWFANALTNDGRRTFTHLRGPIVLERSAEAPSAAQLPWRVFGDSNHATLEAALDRAEQLARGEP